VCDDIDDIDDNDDDDKDSDNEETSGLWEKVPCIARSSVNCSHRVMRAVIVSTTEANALAQKLRKPIKEAEPYYQARAKVRRQYDAPHISLTKVLLCRVTS
jgi:hypothetical protein